MHKNLPPRVLSVTLLLLSTLPIYRLLLSHIPSPSLYLLLPLLDHISSAIFAARYLTFLTGHPSYSLRNIYPFLLPYAPLIELSYSLFDTTASIKHTILSHSGKPAPSYNGCQARFTIFISTNAIFMLSVLQVTYGVPTGGSHYVGLVIPTLVVALREGCSVFTILWIASFIRFGNVAPLTYLIITAVQALREGISLERVLLAPKGDLPEILGEEVRDEGSHLFGKGETSVVLENLEKSEVDDRVVTADDGDVKM